jgi:hypothetical protein
MEKPQRKNSDYFFIDVDLESKQIVGVGTEKRNTVEVNLSDGFHRVFLSKGQFNKLEKKLSENTGR